MATKEIFPAIVKASKELYDIDGELIAEKDEILSVISHEGFGVLVVEKFDEAVSFPVNPGEYNDSAVAIVFLNSVNGEVHDSITLAKKIERTWDYFIDHHDALNALLWASEKTYATLVERCYFPRYEINL